MEQITLDILDKMISAYPSKSTYGMILYVPIGSRLPRKYKGIKIKEMRSIDKGRAYYGRTIFIDPQSEQLYKIDSASHTLKARRNYKWSK